MKRYVLFSILFLFAFGSVMPAAALPPKKKKSKKKKKDEKDPDWIEFALLRDGKPGGRFGFKTVVSGSGKIYTSSKLNAKTRKGELLIRTSVERHPSGKVEKYKKWIGKAAHAPKLIAWWLDGKFRVVSKVKKKRFKRDVSPDEGFMILDRSGFHLYADIVGLWKKSGAGEYPCVVMHKGEKGTVTLADGGSAILKNKKAEEIKARVVALTAPGFKLSVFVGEKPKYLGFNSKKLLVLREGYSLVSVDENDKAVAAEEPPPAEEKPAEEKPAEEKPAEEKPAEEKPAEEKRPPLPD